MFRNCRFILLFMLGLFVALPAFSNQIGVNFSEDSIGALGDYKKVVGSVEFEADAQFQQSDEVSLVANLSLQHNFTDTVGIKPFVAYSRNVVGNVLDVGGVINFSILDLDVAAGASFRGADPAGVGLEPRFDENDNEVQVRPASYTPNAYQLPAIQNVNAVVHTGFEKWKVETDLTGYIPLTERDQVPVILISRSQTSIKLSESISLSLVVDAKTYVHADGVVLDLKPIGSITYRF